MRSGEFIEGGPDRRAGAGPRKEGSTLPQRLPPPAEADGRAAGDGRLLSYRLDDGLLLAVLLLGLDDQREFRAGERALEAPLLLLPLPLPRPLR